MTRRLRLAAVALLSTAMPLDDAHGLDPGRAITQYLHDVWQTEQGLPQNSVSAVLQDRDGFLWLGTQEGLARFDGVKFGVFQKRNTKGIENNFIRSLLEDGEGNLWIGTNGGGLSRLRDGEFPALGIDDGLPGDRVFSLLAARGGVLWVGTNRGLGRLADGKWSTFSTRDGIPGEAVLSLLEDRAGRLWIGTDRGLVRFHDGRVIRDDVVTTAISERRVLAMHEDRHGDFWVGTDSGLVRLRGREARVFTTEVGLPENRVQCLLEDRDANLWIGTGGGLARLAGERFVVPRAGEGLSDTQVSSLYEDREGSLWIGTGSGGLNRLRDGKLTPLGSVEGLAHDVVRTIYEAPAGVLWIGTDGGLSRLSSGAIASFGTRDGLSSAKITALHSDAEGGFWIGTYGGGLNRLEAGRFVPFGRATALAGAIVTAIEHDGEGTLWIGTSAGLSRRRGESFETFGTGDDLPSEVITALRHARDGSLWIGTYGGGLVRRRGNRFEAFRTTEGLSSDLVVCLHEDRRGTLWIGTLGGGITRFDDGRFFAYREEQGLPDDNVYQILEDDQDDLWLSSNRGIFRISRRELDGVRSGSARSLSAIGYGKSDGMRNAECTGGSQPAGFRASDGRLWFPTIRGAVSIDPAKLNLNPVPLRVAIESVVVDGRAIPARGRLELPARSRNIEVHYTAPTFVAPERIRFKYRLEPYDRDWVDAGSRRIAFQTNLAPADYTFRVVAANEDGVWSTAAAEIQFRVPPAIWQTWWFRGATLALAALVFVGAHRARTRRIELRNLELESTVADRTDGLRRYARALEEHAGILERASVEARSADRLKREFLAYMSHELRTPLTSIIGFSEVLLQKLRGRAEERQVRFLEHIHESGHHLLYLINSLLDLSKIEAGRMEVLPEPAGIGAVLDEVKALMLGYSQRRSVQIEIEVDPQLPRVTVDVAKLKQILFNLASNAVKFSPDAGRVWIRARLLASGESGTAEPCFEVAVSDDGPGIAPEEQAILFEEYRQVGSGARTPGGTGLGLALARRLALLQCGTLSVESSRGSGSTFRLRLPVDVAASLRNAASAEAQRRTPGALATGELRRSALVVEDDQESFIFLARVLEEEGLLPVRSRRGEEARFMAKELHPSLVVIDLVRPGLDGWETLRVLKRSPETAHLPVALVTVQGQRELGLALGAAEYFPGPVDEPRLAARIEQLLPAGRRAGGVRSVLLLVEDAGVGRSLRALLERLGLEVRASSSGQADLEQARADPPELILLDLLVSDANGFEVAEAFATDSRTTDVPVILFTSRELDRADRDRLAAARSSLPAEVGSAFRMARAVRTLLGSGASAAVAETARR